MNEETKLPIRQSLVQPVLVAGAERELTILIGFLSAITWMAGKDFVSILLAIGIWFIGIAFARAGVKEDAERTKIFFRHIKYKDFYPATEKIESPIKEAKTFKV